MWSNTVCMVVYIARVFPSYLVFDCQNFHSLSLSPVSHTERQTNKRDTSVNKLKTDLLLQPFWHTCISKSHNQHTDMIILYMDIRCHCSSNTCLLENLFIFFQTPRWLHGNLLWSLGSSLGKKEPEDQIRKKSRIFLSLLINRISDFVTDCVCVRAES